MKIKFDIAFNKFLKGINGKKLDEPVFRAHGWYYGKFEVNGKRETFFMHVSGPEFDACINGKDVSNSRTGYFKTVDELIKAYNEANVEPEYENCDFYGDEANPIEIYNTILDKYNLRKDLQTKDINEN